MGLRGEISENHRAHQVRGQNRGEKEEKPTQQDLKSKRGSLGQDVSKLQGTETAIIFQIKEVAAGEQTEGLELLPRAGTFVDNGNVSTTNYDGVQWKGYKMSHVQWV